MTATFEAPTREELIALIERGSVPQAAWHDRDSAGAQKQLGECLMLLRAGCDFEVREKSNLGSWMLIVRYTGFNHFEWDEELDSDFFYVPTAERLSASNGKDWY